MPPVDLPPGVVDFAEVDVVPHNRAGMGAPAVIGDYRTSGTILEFDVQLCQEARPAGRQILPQVATAPHPQRQRIVPPIAKRNTKTVLPFL